MGSLIGTKGEQCAVNKPAAAAPLFPSLMSVERPKNEGYFLSHKEKWGKGD